MFEVVRDECKAVREQWIIGLTGFAKYDVTGADAEAFESCAGQPHAAARGGIGASSRGHRATVTRDFREHLSAASAELRDLDHLKRRWKRVNGSNSQYH